jgi:hypothetical protein
MSGPLTTVTAEEHCPCGKRLNRASDLATTRIPVAGDLGVCVKCGMVHEFVDGVSGLARKFLTDQEIPLEARAVVSRYRLALAMSRRHRT